MPHSNYSKIFDLLTEMDRADGPQGIFEPAEQIHEQGSSHSPSGVPDPTPTRCPSKLTALPGPSGA